MEDEEREYRGSRVYHEASLRIVCRNARDDDAENGC